MNKSHRKILVVTGKRGGFGAFIPTLKELSKKPNVELLLVATDQHLYEEFGHTYQEVQKWFDIDHFVPMDQKGDKAVYRCKALSRCMSGMAEVFEKEKSDLLLILGDRGEIITTVITAIHFKIPIAHIQGGDISGNIDEFIRHAITKMSHIHFPSTDAAADRIIKMGEEPWRVNVVGDLHLDMIHQGNYTKPDEVRRKFNLEANRPIFLILQHSDTSNDGESYEEMKEILEVVTKYDAQKIVVYPCTDPGYEGIVKKIEEYRNTKDIQIYKNIDCLDFWGLQNVASVFIGNSSAGLIETPAFNLPSITIGNRQNGRLRGVNCLTVDHDFNEIKMAVDKCLYDREFKKIIEKIDSPYGNGQGCHKIAEILSTIELNSKLFNKRMTY